MRGTLFALLFALLAVDGARAQVATRPHLAWRTIRTAHFTVHYPAEVEAWTLDLVPRLEAAHDEVAAMVGFAPRRVTVVVEDPSAQANGSAYPFLDQPAISLWPTPPDPRSSIGSTRDPAEQLAVHELAHIAHMGRPSRNPRRNRLVRLLPVRNGPIGLRAPRWLTEGYATYVEGKLTGSGRPHSVIRAAILRQWALEGKLPRYDQLDATGGFQGGSMAYLAGSAFLEWLVEQRGERSLPDLWRRMTARRERTFDAAFAGVFGAGPAELYAHFTVDVTERALAARTALRAARLAVGDTVQRLNWATGDPAVSPDGRQVAVVLRGATASASRVVVWRAEDERIDTAAVARARRALLAADPEDVPDLPARRAAKRPLATLFPVNGRPHDQPRFMPDGRGILVVRSEPLRDGAVRPDLFLWEWRTKALRRVTRGAGVRWPDPAPDGRSAVAVQCRGGLCGIATVDLATGAVRTLVEARPNLVFYRPRWSPDGASIAVSVQEGGRWRVALAGRAGGALRRIGPDDGASRYDAAFLPDGRSLVLVSERGGIANLEVLEIATGAVRPLTRVTGAAAAPEPDRYGGVFYLSLHSRGMDVMRIPLDSAARGPVVALDTALSPAAPPAAAVAPDTLRRGPLPPSRAYGLGPRRTNLLPTGTLDANGASAGLVLTNGDPVGRLTAMLRVIAGEAEMPRGAALALIYRRWLPVIGLDAFYLQHRPSTDGAGIVLPADSLDARYPGAALSIQLPWAGSALRHRLRVGASAGALKLGDADATSRTLAFAEAMGSLTKNRGANAISTTLRLHGSVGRTGGAGWTRGVGTMGMGIRFAGLNGRGELTYGAVSAGAPRWERFEVGGAPQPLFDDAILPQRLPLPAARFGVVRGRQVLAYRVSTQLSGLTPYLAGAAGSGGHGEWHRVAGVEAAFENPAISLLGIPGVRFVAGAGYPLDAPDRHRVRVYGTVTYRP
ncbi:MAG: hypothetical protein ACJ8GN_09165 [Longimicrobiaceae bacterium]